MPSRVLDRGVAAGVSLTLLFGLVLTVATLAALSGMLGSLGSLHSEFALRLDDAQELALEAERVSAAARAFLLTGDEDAEQRLSEARARLRSDLLALERRLEPEGARLVQAILAAERMHHAATLQARSGIASGEALDGQFETQVLPARDALIQAGQALLAQQRARFIAAAAREEAQARQSMLAVAALSLVFALGGALTLLRLLAAARAQERDARADAAAAHEERKDADRRFRATFDQLSAGAVQHSLSGHLMRVNQRFAELLGYDQPEALVGHAMREVSPLEELALDEQALLQLVSGGAASLSRERRFLDRRGQLVWTSMSTTLVRDDDGRPLYCISLLLDVTERRRTEQTIRESRDLLNAILHGASDGIVVHASDGQLVFANDAAARIFGFSASSPLVSASAEEVTQRISIEDEWGRELLPGDLPGAWGLSSQATPERLVCLRTRPVGHERWVKVRASPLPDVRGKPRLTVSFFRDVTESRKAELERALWLERERAARADAQASERHYRQLAESIPQLVWTSDAGGAADYHNERWYEYSGLPKGSQERAPLLALCHPEDRPRLEETWSEARTRGEPCELELRLRRASDASYRWHLARAYPLTDAEGRVTRWCGSATDIEDWKRSSQAVKFLCEAAPRLTSSLDEGQTLDGLAVVAAPELADVALLLRPSSRGGPELAVAAGVELGAEPAPWAEESWAALEEKGAFVCSDAFLGPSRSLAQAVRAVLPEGEQVRSALAVPIHAGGEVAAALVLVTIGTGRTLGEADLTLAEELGRRAGLALENARLYREAQVAVRLRDDFVATVSHELRTPLNAILGWAQLLRGGRMDERRRERALETIERNARVQAQLVEDILDMSRIISGKLRLSMRPLSLAGVVDAAVEALRPAAEAAGLTLRWEREAPHASARGDAERLQQVVWNLLSNAIKFTPRGGTVTLTLREEAEEAVLTVHDTGQGIRQDFLPHVFDRFRQGDSSSTRRHGGLGLGLSIVRQLVEAHRGTVTVESEGEGHGALFTLRLPCLRQSAEEAAADEAHPPAALEGVSVLLVDDLEDAREVLRELLASFGARVQTVSSAAEALRALSSQPPDVLMSDLGMPGEDGLALLRQVRALPAERGGQTPAIAVSAYAAAEDRAMALSSGYQEHLAKPVGAEALVTLIRRLVVPPSPPLAPQPPPPSAPPRRDASA